MKKFLVGCLLVFILGCGIRVYKASTEKTYPKFAKVDRIENGIVAFVEFNGNEWLWENPEDWQVDDYAVLTMGDCGTEDIYDDRIITAWYERIDF